MPIGYLVDRERRFVLVRGWGTLTEADVSAQAQALRSDPTVSPAFNVLVDLRDASAQDIRLNFMEHFPTAFDRSSRRAIVVNDVYVLALAHTYGGSASVGGATIVTRDFGEALAWLRLPAETRLPDVLTATFGLEAMG